MKSYLIIVGLLFYGGLAALYWFIKQYVGSTVSASIEHQFDEKLEIFKQNFLKDLHTLDRKDKYALAALEKRMDAHQKAFAISRKMVGTIHSEASVKDSILKECHSFMDEYYLFLDNKAKTAFWEATVAYSYYESLLHNLKYAKENQDIESIHELRNEIKVSFSKIRQLGGVILQSVDLESKAIEPIDAMGKIIPDMDETKI